jgi:hypothetical protein
VPGLLDAERKHRSPRAIRAACSTFGCRGLPRSVRCDTPARSSEHAGRTWRTAATTPRFMRRDETARVLGKAGTSVPAPTGMSRCANATGPFRQRFGSLPSLLTKGAVRPRKDGPGPAKAPINDNRLVGCRAVAGRRESRAIPMRASHLRVTGPGRDGHWLPPVPSERS